MEQKKHKVKVYQLFIETMQSVIGKEIIPKAFDHPVWGEFGSAVIFETVKRVFD